jgi:hypothetical protein
VRRGLEPKGINSIILPADHGDLGALGMRTTALTFRRVARHRTADDGLEYFAFIERPNDGGDHIHQLKLLPFHIVGEQPSRIRREFEEPVVKYLSESSMGWPQRIMRSTCSGVMIEKMLPRLGTAWWARLANIVMSLLPGGPLRTNIR